MERLEVRHLRTLCAIADTDSLRRAAAAQGYSQPALTTQLQRIELYFGEPLFARSSVDVAPTALGAEIVAQARDVPARMDALGPRANRSVKAEGRTVHCSRYRPRREASRCYRA